MAVTKSFNVEFDDALLDLEGWKASRYEGSKLKARYINEFNKGPKNTSSIFLGSNPNLSIPSSANTFKLYAPGAPAIGTFSAAEKPLIKGQFKNSNPAQTELVHDKMDLSGQGLANTEVWGGDILGPKRDDFNFVVGTKKTVIPLGTTLTSAEDEDYRLVRFDGHSYVVINRFLVVNKDLDNVRVIQAEEFHTSSLMPVLSQICEEGSKINIKLLDKNIPSNLKSSGYYVKSNLGTFRKIYGYEPPRVRLPDGGYQTSSFFGPKSSDGVAVGFSSVNKGEATAFTRIEGSYAATVAGQRHTFNVFSYGQTLTGSANTSSAVPAIADASNANSFPSMFFRTTIDGGYNHEQSGSLTDMYSSSFHVPRDPRGRVLVIDEIRNVGYPWLASTHFTSIISASGGTSKYSGSFKVENLGDTGNTINVYSTGFEGVSQPRNPLRTFINTKLIPDIASGSNRYFITMESGNFGIKSRKLESICTGELRIAGHARFFDELEHRTIQEVTWRSAGADGITDNETVNIDGHSDPFGYDFELTLGLTPRGIPSSLNLSQSFHSVDTGWSSPHGAVAVYNGQQDFDGTGLGTLHGYVGGKLSISASFAYPYSGYQLSVLREDPTLIIDLNKDIDLPQGIGTKGFAIMPKDIDPEILSNIEYYFEKAGLYSDDKANQFKFGKGMT